MRHKRIRRLTAAVCAVLAMLSCAAAAQAGYTVIDDVAGISFSSVNDLSELVFSGADNIDALNDVETDVKDRLLNHKSIFIPKGMSGNISALNTITLTPTYAAVSFDNDGTMIELYHYYDSRAGKSKLDLAKKYASEGNENYPAQTGEAGGNTVYSYASVVEGGSYYCWEQGGNYFMLRVYGDTDTGLYLSSCIAEEYDLAEKNTGWQTINGRTYYIKSDGTKQTGSAVIDGIRYKFSSDGECKGRYTGWTRSKKGRRAWKNGVMYRNRWLKTKDGKYYYAGADGYMRTGWANVTRNEGFYSYFDKNGVWDGQVHYVGYRPDSLRTFLADFPFPEDGDYVYTYKEGVDKSAKPFGYIKEILGIISPDLDSPLLYDSFSYGEEDIEQDTNEKIWHGGKHIIISSDDKRKRFIFTKDEDGNSYLYQRYFGFGCKLSDKDAYDKIMELTKK